MSIFIAASRWQPLCYKQSPAFTQKFQKSLFISANTYEKYIVCTGYSIAHHDVKTCFLPTCKYHILLLGNVEELLKKLCSLCITYQHVDCLYTLFKINSVEKLLQRGDKCLISCNEQLTSITGTRKCRECRALQKKDCWRKSSTSIYSAPFKRQKQRRPLAQCLPKESKKLQRPNLNRN